MKSLIYPRVSEKSYAGVSSLNVYTFNVPIAANKLEIKHSVETLYSVEVINVNIVNTVGKPKRTVKKSGRQIKGHRAGYKKAYVTVKKGQTIPVFASEEKDKKEAKKGDK
jgi:large subunit ribosomal protein L23